MTFTIIKQKFTCEMCSAAATLGFTTSQFAITRVFGTLPSVYQQKPKTKINFSQQKKKSFSPI